MVVDINYAGIFFYEFFYLADPFISRSIQNNYIAEFFLQLAVVPEERQVGPFKKIPEPINEPVLVHYHGFLTYSGKNVIHAGT